MREGTLKMMAMLQEARAAYIKDMSSEDVVDKISAIYFDGVSGEFEDSMLRSIAVCNKLAAIEFGVFDTLREMLDSESQEPAFEVFKSLKDAAFSSILLGATENGKLTKKEAKDLCPYHFSTPEWHIFQNRLDEILDTKDAAEAIREYDEKTGGA